MFARFASPGRGLKKQNTPQQHNSIFYIRNELKKFSAITNII